VWKGHGEKMDLIKTANELANLMNEKGLSFIRVRDGKTEVEIGSGGGSVSAAIPVSAPVAVNETSAPVQPVQAAVAGGNYVKSPIIGTFYSAPAPDKPAFVKAGDKVEVGQVVCIVESMKLMNEITSEFGGTVAEILVKDGEAVEFGKELIRIQ
jgi:acetyl-CoA carboxylase biotin carboxyl carrier protein